MIYVGENKSILYRGDFHPAELYKGDKKIAGYELSEFQGAGSVTLENCYNDKLRNTQIFGNSIQDGTPTPETPVEVQSVGELATEGEYAGKYKIPVTARGKNLFKYISGGLANGSIIEQLPNGAIVKGNLNPDTTALYVYSKGWFRPGRQQNTATCPFLLVGDTVTVSADITLLEIIADDGHGIGFSLTARDASAGYDLETIQLAVGETRRLSWTIENTKSDAIYYPVFKLNSNVFKIENIQIEYGDTASPFELYIEPQTFNIYLDEPLRKVGDYADCIDADEKKVIRKCGLRYLKDYSWNMSSSYEEHCSFSAVDNSIMPRYVDFSREYSYAFSPQFSCLFASGGNVAKTVILMGQWARNIRVNFLKSDFVFESVQDFNNWLIKNNPYMIRILAEPTEEPVDLPKLPTFKGTTIYEIDTDITAIISGKYKKVEE